MKKRSRKGITLGWIIGVASVIALGFVAAAWIGLSVKYPWIPSYVQDQLLPSPIDSVKGTKHILFTFVDHFEPHNQATMDRWMESLPKVVANHADADGKKPQHTYFWYFSQSDDEESLSFLKQLARLSYEDLGEVEIHLHHSNDDESAWKERMTRMLRLSKQTGAMTTQEARPQTAFGFIHGMWALDNSRNGEFCGVNNELILLRQLGCYADFTHASWGSMNPSVVNQLYYATDDPKKPKSYNTGVEMEVGKPPVGDLLIFEGPSFIRFNGIRPVYDHGDVTHVDLPTPKRIDAWIKTGIHVKGRPEWTFVKIFTHGVVPEDHDAVLGKWRDEMHTYLEETYNDGENYALHYVNAREAYNIAKAAEAGETGNPNEYRDFVIPPYVSRFFNSDFSFETLSFTDRAIVVRFLEEKGAKGTVRLKGGDVEVSGNIRIRKKEETERETVLSIEVTGEGSVGFSFTRKKVGA